MKSIAVYHGTTFQRKSIPYPNSASIRQHINKLLDLLLITATCVSTVTILLFLLALR